MCFSEQKEEAVGVGMGSGKDGVGRERGGGEGVVRTGLHD